jgi:hypothetical protein
MMKRLFQTMLALSLLMMGMVACAPGDELSLPAEAEANTAATTETITNGETVLETTTLDGPMPDVIVDATPMSEAELANQPPESSPSGAGESDAGGGFDPGSGVTEEMEISRDTWSVYTDSTYQFAMAHPADFVVRPLDSAKLAEFTPAPLASIRFMSPAIANSDLGDLDIPELNVRIFPAPPDGSLENWLVASGLATEGDSAAAYQNAAVSGLQVCLSTMLAPNCSIFVMGNGWVYQLTPLGPVGEAMVDSFSLSS